MLPTMLSNNKTSVDYIQIYDNSGTLQTITSFSLYNGTKQLQDGWRYSLEIKMEGLVPTVNPYQILEWGEERDITDERLAGIKDETEFEQWLFAYNTYKESGNDSGLENFGDKIEDTDGNVTWHFYLLNSLDLKNQKLNISKLTDIFDGLGNTISNLSLENGFINELSGNGELMNINFEGLTVKSNSVSPGGGLVTDMKGGAINDCNVDATVISNGPVGIMAATMTGGTVNKATFSGLLIGSASSTGPYKNLLATDPSGEVSITNTNYSSIIFTSKN